MATFRLGTCSWKYPSWRGLVYSAGEGINLLEEYARQYDTVEIDQWFWSLHGAGLAKLPQQRDVYAYRQSVPDDFRFTVKVPNSLTLTHHYRKRKTDALVPNPHFLSSELFERFMTRIAPLHDVLGPLMLQFEYLNKEKMQDQARFQNQWESFVQTLPRDFTYAVEVRNARYLNSSHFAFLQEHGLTPVLLEGYWMPPVADVYQQWQEQIRACGQVIVRLHGADRKRIETTAAGRWDRIVEPKDAELARILKMLEDLKRKDTAVYVNVNNHYEGSAPLTIEKIRGGLDLGQS